MPRVDDLINRVGGAPFITTLDLTKRYWQVSVAKDDQEKTAFTTPFGLFHFTRMPFGLRGAPATFQRIVDQILNDLQDYAGAYLDDVIIIIQSHVGRPSCTPASSRTTYTGSRSDPLRQKVPFRYGRLCIPGTQHQEWTS